MINQNEKSIDVSEDGKGDKRLGTEWLSLGGILRRKDNQKIPVLQENTPIIGEIVFHNDGSVSVVESRNNF